VIQKPYPPDIGKLTMPVSRRLQWPEGSELTGGLPAAHCAHSVPAVQNGAGWGPPTPGCVLDGGASVLTVGPERFGQAGDPFVVSVAGVCILSADGNELALFKLTSVSNDMYLLQGTVTLWRVQASTS
jgi:hypothetical protein